jgi:hypothetical protein
MSETTELAFVIKDWIRRYDSVIEVWPSDIAPLVNYYNVCYANATFQLIMRMGSFRRCVAAMRASVAAGCIDDTCMEKYAPAINIIRMYDNYVERDKEGIATPFFEWTKALRKNKSAFTDTGGYPSMLLYLLMDSMKPYCTDVLQALDVHSFHTRSHREGATLTYSKFLHRFAKNPVSEHVVTYNQANSITILTSDDEWMNGCVVEGRRVQIVGFVSVFIPRHAICVFLDAGKWLFVEDDYLSEVPPWLARILFQRHSLSLISIDMKDVTVGTRSRRELYPLIEPFHVTKLNCHILNPVKTKYPMYHRLPTCTSIIPHQYQFEPSMYDVSQLGIVPPSDWRRAKPPHVELYVSPHIENILTAFFQMCLLREVHSSDVCTTPLRIGIAPGDAIMAIGSSDSIMPALITLAALRSISSFATVLPFATFGRPAPFEERLRDVNPSPSEFELLSRSADISDAVVRTKYRKITLLVVGFASNEFLSNLDAVREWGYVIDVVMIPYTIMRFYTSIKTYVAVMSCIFTSHEVRHNTSCDTIPDNRIVIPSSVGDTSKAMTFATTDGHIIHPYAGNFRTELVTHGVVMPPRYHDYLDATPVERIVQHPPDAAIEFDKPMMVSKFMWRQLLACAFCSHATKLRILPWKLFVPSAFAVAWIGPDIWCRAAGQVIRPGSKSAARGVSIELQVVEEENVHPVVKMSGRTFRSPAWESTESPVSSSHYLGYQIPVGTTEIRLDTKLTMWFRVDSVWFSDIHSPERPPHCVEDISKVGISFVLTPYDTSSSDTLSVALKRVSSIFKTRYPWFNSTIPAWSSRVAISPDHVLWHFGRFRRRWYRLEFDSSGKASESDVMDTLPSEYRELDIRTISGDTDWNELIDTIKCGQLARPKPCWAADIEKCQITGTVWYRFGYGWWRYNGTIFAEGHGPIRQSRKYTIQIPRYACSPHNLQALGHAMALSIQHTTDNKYGFYQAKNFVYEDFARFAKHALSIGAPCCEPPSTSVTAIETKTYDPYVLLSDGSTHYISADCREWTAIPTWIEPAAEAPPPARGAPPPARGAPPPARGAPPPAREASPSTFKRHRMTGDSTSASRSIAGEEDDATSVI